MVFSIIFNIWKISISHKGGNTIKITCEADSTWSGLPEEKRECEAFCGEELSKPIHSKFNDYLENPNDEPQFECTDGDRLGSVCTVKCPTGFHQEWTTSKYGPTTSVECKKKQGEHWWKDVSKVTSCAPIACNGWFC